MNIVVTLAERRYLEGACVLYNSLVANGFEGTFVVGVRSIAGLPQRLLWQVSGLCDANQSSQLVSWHWIEVDTDLHFTNYKPQLMSKIFALYPSCDFVAYSDPDIVCIDNWHWLFHSSSYGPVVAADVNWSMPVNHPTRRDWQHLISCSGYSLHHDLDLYFNAGFVALRRSDSQFLDLWRHYILTYGPMGCPLDAIGEITTWRLQSRANPMFCPDQDALNMALMSWPEPLSTFGADMMGFTHGFTCLPHAIGSNKPWNKKILRDSLSGIPPRLVDKFFWQYTQSPVQVYSKTFAYFKKLTIAIASLIGRFYHRV